MATEPQVEQLKQLFDGGADQDAISSTTDSVHEALFLFAIAGVGIALNVIVLACIFFCRHLRRMTSAFIFHGTVLDVIKCVFCFPFATSLLRDVEPDFCGVLGGTYVIMVTASGFNIVSSICCEAYTFSEHNVGADGRGSLCCVMFGLLMVYIGSIIIHLGPTIIGGVFKYNDTIGNCIFKYGTIQSYVVHAMWIVIMTLSMVGAIYYIVFFYRHVQSNSTHRLASLVRASIAVSRGNTDNQDIRKVIRESLSRTRVLMLITALYVICWYPLFVLTLVDPGFLQPPRVYRLLTFVAWSNGALNPLVMLLFDRNLSMLQRRVVPCGGAPRCLCCCETDDDDHTADEYEHTDMPLMLQPGTSSRTATNSRASSRAGSLPRGLSSAPVYQRVGCRLCQEGQAHPGTQCNGEVATKFSMKRDSSMCELHTFSVM